MSAELAMDDSKIKSMVTTLLNLETQIEIKGKTATKRSHLYNHLRKAFVKKCANDSSNFSRTKVSGKFVETKIESILSTVKSSIPFQI